MKGSFDALANGLFQRFKVHGQPATGGALLNSREWNAAVAQGWHGQFEPVGSCRRCGHDMRPLPTTTVGHITWYEAECVHCQGVIASPNQEILRRSGRWSEQPSGFMSGRAKKQGF